VRNVDPEIGTLGGRSFVVHGGLVYLLSPDGGLYVTDGTRIEPAQGSDKVRQYINDRLDAQLATDDTINWLPSMQVFQDFIYISLTAEENDPITLVYHPTTGSFWPTNLPILDSCVGRVEGEQKFWFIPTSEDGLAVYELMTDPDEATFATDIPISDPVGIPQAIAWNIRSAWIQFGTTRNERRLRKVWGFVYGEDAHTVDVDTFRNFDIDTPLTTVTRTLGRNPAFAEFVEGLVGQTNTMYSVAVELSGEASADFTVYGFGVDTEPHRFGRFHRRP
jgi:hypothetical protein